MTGEFRILDRTGHTVVEWDTEAPTGDLPQDEVDAEFKRIFDTGKLAYAKVEDPETGKKENVQLHRGDFNPEEHEKVTFVPPFMGG